MDEEGEITPRGEEETDNDAIDDRASTIDGLAIPQEEANIVQRALGLVMGVVGPTGNPLLRRITSDHITQWLNNRENADRRAHSAANFERWILVWFGTIILVAAVGLIVLFGIRETYEVVTAIIGGLLGFAGGFGVGKMRR